MSTLLLSIFSVFLQWKLAYSQQTRPNFVIILADDQDLLMDSPSYMPSLQSLIVNQGMTFSNAFVATPVCCPSRTEFVSGRYYHNIGAPNGTCMFINAQKYVFNENSLFSKMYQNGYKTGVFGKLTNDDGSYFCNNPLNVTNAGMSRVYSMCQTDNYYALKYINYTENASTETHIDSIQYQYTNLSYNDPGSYQGSQIGNKSIAFIEKQLKLGNNFLAYIGFHEPHIAYTPAAWFANAFSNVSLPQNPSFNYQTKKHMPWLNTQPALNDTNIKDMTKIYQDRLASTLQIDITINEIYNLLSSYNQLDNTYIIYFSDHGYHLGQYRIPCEKYQAFDTDIRVPYYIRGPGLNEGSKTDIVVGNVDVMPTVLDLAGVDVPDSVDGKSFKSQILSNNGSYGTVGTWRDVFLVEFLSPFQQYFNRCTTWYPKTNDFHGETKNPSPFTTNGSLVWVNFGKKENPGNNYREIRIINSTHDWAYTEYINYTFTENDKENPWLYVLFDLNEDPYELNNIYDNIKQNVKTQLHQMLMQYGSCQGSTCP